MPTAATKVQQRPGKRKAHRKSKKKIYKETFALQTQGVQRETVRIQHLLEDDEASQYAWLAMILNPWGPVARVPLILGNGIWEEKLYRYFLFGTVTANSSGTASALMTPDNWEVGGSGSFANYMGYTTVGTPLFVTTASYTATTSPALGATTATTGLLSVPLAANTSYGDANPTSDTRITNSACAVRVRPISTSDSTGGLVMVAFTKDPYNYPLTGVEYGTVRGYPADIVTVHEVAANNWSPDSWLTMPALPLERHAFEADLCLANGKVGVERSPLGVFCTGLAASQAFEVEACMVYQVELDGSNEVPETEIVAANPVAQSQEAGKKLGDDLKQWVANQKHHNSRSISRPMARSIITPNSAQVMTNHLAAGPHGGLGSNLVQHGIPVLANAAQAMMRAKPGLATRIKDKLKNLLKAGIRYGKDNWASILGKVATGIGTLLI